MKKYFLTLAVVFYSMFATAQTNQYFWHNGNLMMGNPIAQIDSVTFGEGEPADTLHILLPRTIIKEVHDTVYLTIHDTVCPNQLPEGALPGEFSVSPTKKVRFSKGNLQYNAALGSHQCADGTTQQGTWRFAEHQWDYVGDATNGTVYENGVKCDNALISQTYNGWIDLFGWGTSGWNSGALAYQPWSINTSCSDYWVGGSYNNDLTKQYANADWGMFNSIINGGNESMMWRCLTKQDIQYLMQGRQNASLLYGLATVNSIHGCILLPDSWKDLNGIIFTPTINSWTTNTYTLEQWLIMESHGAIFLPCGGRQDRRKSYVALNEGSGYWSSTHYDRTPTIFSWAEGLLILESDIVYSGVGNYNGLDVSCGHLIRLVQDIE